MRIRVANQALDDATAAAIRDRADQLLKRADLRGRPGSLDAGLLTQVDDDLAFDREFLRLLSDRAAVDTAAFAFPRKPGLPGAAMFKLRAFMWKLLRYQHDRMSSRQNRINRWIISALEQRTDRLQREVDELRSRLTAMQESDQPAARGDGETGP